MEEGGGGRREEDGGGRRREEGGRMGEEGKRGKSKQKEDLYCTRMAKEEMQSLYSPGCETRWIQGPTFPGGSCDTLTCTNIGT